MADKKITELDELLVVSDSDVFPIVEVAVPETKKVLMSRIKATLKSYFDTLYLGTSATTASIADSADKRYCTDAQKTVISNTSGTNSGNETTGSLGAIIVGAAAKDTPHNNDMIGLMDSEALNVVKKLSWYYLKTRLQTVFDALYLPVSATTASIADSADKRYCTDAQKTVISNTSGTNSGNETITSVSALIAGASSTTVADGDDFSFIDISASNILRRISWSTIKSTLKTYFDTLYQVPPTWADFTPTVTLSGGSGNTVPVYTYNTGRYIAIGNAVYCRVRLASDGGAEGAGTGQFCVALPVAAGASNVNVFVPVGRASNSTTNFLLTGRIAESGTVIEISKWTAIDAMASFTGADQNNTTRGVYLDFWYEK